MGKWSVVAAVILITVLVRSAFTLDVAKKKSIVFEGEPSERSVEPNACAERSMMLSLNDVNLVSLRILLSTIR